MIKIIYFLLALFTTLKNYILTGIILICSFMFLTSETDTTSNDTIKGSHGYELGEELPFKDRYFFSSLNEVHDTKLEMNGNEFRSYIKQIDDPVFRQIILITENDKVRVISLQTKYFASEEEATAKLTDIIKDNKYYDPETNSVNLDNMYIEIINGDSVINEGKYSKTLIYYIK